MRTSDEIFQDIRDRFESKTGDTQGTVLDMYSKAVAEVDADVYEEIENNKTPHVWSKLQGKDLDATGLWVNCPRDPEESDASYRYRLMQWMLRNEASNETAIKVKLLNPQYARNIEFVAMTNGCGTGTCYVLPRHYTEENIAASLKEAKERIHEIASPTTYIDYIIPEIKAVSFSVYLKTEDGDEAALKKNITAQVREYVNSIAPKEYLSVGTVNKIGANMSHVDYFSVLALFINGEQTSKIKLLQEIETKFIFDNITWLGDSNDVNV